MSIPAGTIALFRNQWSKRFVDTCVIKAEDPDAATFSESTGQTTRSYVNQYSGACLWRDAGARATELGEEETHIRRGVLYVPHDTTGIAPGMLADITSTRDGDLNGLTVTVRSISVDTYNTRKALDCEEVQSD